MKSKNGSGYKSLWFIIGLVIFLTVIALLNIRSHGEKTDKQLRKMCLAHIMSKPKSRWFVEFSEQSATPALIRIFSEKRQSLIDSAKIWCPTNKLGRSIMNRLPKWNWTISFEVDKNSHLNRGVVILPGGENMVLVVPHCLSSLSEPNSFFCNRKEDGRLIHIDALDMPPQIFASFTLHEMGHAEHYWYENALSSRTEEVIMHELSFEILNSYSHGAYLSYIESMLDREQQTNSWRRAYDDLGERDLNRLDELVGATNLGQEAEFYLMTQHMLSIGFTAVRRWHLDDQDKVALYDWHESISKAQNP